MPSSAPPPLQFLVDGDAGDAGLTVLFAHGAGAPMDSPWMQSMAEGLAQRGFRVVRFEFPYMRQRRRTQGRRPPDRAPILEQTWFEAVRRFDTPRLVLAGKSMGGRMATHVVDEVGAAAAVAFGYPFHPSGKPEVLRTAHLETLRTPLLIVQGERDKLGSRDEIAKIRLSPQTRVHFLADGDHSFKPRKKSGRTWEQNLDEAQAATARFLSQLKRTA